MKPVRWFQMSLNMGAAADARAYLDRRGLNGEALQQFEIGFAPNDRAGCEICADGARNFRTAVGGHGTDHQTR
jgi:DNA primase